MQLKTTRRTYHFYAAEQNSVQEWIDKIQLCIWDGFNSMFWLSDVIREQDYDSNKDIVTYLLKLFEIMFRLGHNAILLHNSCFHGWPSQLFNVLELLESIF